MGAGRNPKATADNVLDTSQVSQDEEAIIGGVKSHEARAEKSDSHQSLSTTYVRQTGGENAEKNETKPKLMPIRSIKGRILKWMADTGASIDAIDIHLLSKAGRRKVRTLFSQRTFETAAGDVNTNSSIELHSDQIGAIDAVLLNKTPPVISIGKRCMQHGFGFYWPPYADPHIILPDGKTRVQCVVEDFVPYIVEDYGTVCPIATNSNSNPSSSSRAVDPDDVLLKDLVRDESLNQSAKKPLPKVKDAENDASGCKDQEKTVVAGTGGKLNKDDIPLMKL